MNTWVGMTVTSQTADGAATIAAAFVAARRKALALATYPGPLPADMAGAYAIQDHAIALDGRPIAGWKVGRIPSPLVEAMGCDRLAGPIFTDSVVSIASGEEMAMPVFEGGFAAVEAEFMLHVAPGFAGPVPHDDAGTLGILDDIRIGIEIASSPYPRINLDGPAVTASDFGNNYGLILGPTLDNWRKTDLCAIPLRVEIDGAEVGHATAATMLDGPLGAVRFLLANLASRGIGTDQGLWISTGAVTGVHEIAIGQKALADFGSHGNLGCLITKAQPA